MKLLRVLVIWTVGVAANGAPLTTVQDTPLRFPAADLTAGSSLQISAVLPQSSQGGHVSLVNTQVWTARYAGPGFEHDQPTSMVVDGAGNVIVAGNSYGGMSGYDFVVVKYSGAGIALWTNRFSGQGSGGTWGDICRNLAIDRVGDLYVFGESARPGFSRDIVTLKYSGNGTPLWTNRFSVSATNDLQLSDTAVDEFGNTFLIAHDFAYDPNGPDYDWIVAYAPTGAILWTNRHQAAFPDAGYTWKVALDSTGRLYVGGEMLRRPALAYYDPNGVAGPAFAYNIGGHLTELLVDRHDYLLMSAEVPWPGPTVGYLISKIANDGTLLWTNAFQGPSYSGGYSPRTTMDNAGNILFTFASAESESLDADYTTVKLTGSGVPIWTNRFFNPGGKARFHASTTDRARNLYLQFSATKDGESNNFDYLLVKYAPDGSPVWTNRFDSGSDELATSFAIDHQGNVFVTGATNWYTSDFLTIKYSDYVLYTPPAGFVGTDSFQFRAVDRFGNAITMQASVTVSPAPLRLSNPGFVSSGFRMRLEGSAITNPIVIVASSNLLHWTPIATNPPGTTEFTDPRGLTVGRRFYKAASSGIESSPAPALRLR